MVKTINNSTDFAMYLLEEAHVATVGGDAFGDPDCFRMSYATSDENIVEAIKRIKGSFGQVEIKNGKTPFSRAKCKEKARYWYKISQYLVKTS